MKKPVSKAEPIQEGSDLFDLKVQDKEISTVLEMLGEFARINILVEKGVTGTVTANLQGVTIEQALSEIWRSLGYVFEREDDFVFVMTETDAKARK